MNTSYFKVMVGSNRAERSPEPAVDAKEKAERIMSRKPSIIDFSRFFFFDERDPASILRAWEGARASGSAWCIAAYRTPPVQGPWSNSPAVGETHAAPN